MTAKLLLCDCAGSFAPDARALEAATGLRCARVATALCGAQRAQAAETIKAGKTIIACAQEAELFATLAAELKAPAPLCVDIRDRAGWSQQDAQATPKMAALIAAAQAPRRPDATMDVASGGLCLLIGASDVALTAAAQLADALAVTCLLTDDAEITPKPVRSFEIAAGRVRAANGALGRFAVTIESFRPLEPAGRGPLSFGPDQGNVASDCDIILDLSGAAPLFPAHEKRDGYLRADPANPRAVAKAVFDTAQLVGVFEKTLHVALDASLCAHARAGQTGCAKCLDACPTGAIAPAGDHVTVDPAICAGCGACSALCPSGAISYDAPRVQEIFDEIRLLAETYRKAGGAAPRLLVHDHDHGAEMIALAARFGRGLPADVIPLSLPALAVFGHAEMLAALACGFATVDLLPGPTSDRETLTREITLAGAILGVDRVRLIDAIDPDALTDALYVDVPAPLCAEPILPLGRRRDAAKLAAKALRPGAAPIPLPTGAPYGAVLVDQEACTLCLSCAGLCPSGALGDNPNAPELSFREDACLQCGLCAAICPEDAITLAPRLDLSAQALSAHILKAEEPFACISCGKLFGVKSTVERIAEKLKNHPMLSGAQADLVRMCDDCRVRVQMHDENAPMAMGPRPSVRTTDDYLKKKLH